MEINGSKMTLAAWGRGLVTKLLEVTHGHWIYRNTQVHVFLTRLHATHRKEEIKILIEDQIEMGGGGLEESDKYLFEINLEDLETTSGETQEYWLLAIKSAREAHILRETHKGQNIGQTTT